MTIHARRRLERTGGQAQDIGRVSADGVRDYLQRIGRTPLLTAEEEVDLAKRIEVGVLAGERLANDPEMDAERKGELLWLIREGNQAYTTFIRANLRLVVTIAKHYTGRGLPMMDVIQEGNLGLVRAVEKFDCTVGNKFSTYATWWIRQSILRGIADSARLIRIPVHTVEKMDRVKRIHQNLLNELGRTPTQEELASACGISAEEVSRLQKTDNETVSLASPVGGQDGLELGDLIEDTDTPGPWDATVLRLRHDDINQRLQLIPSRDATVVRLRYGLDGHHPLTLDEVGELYGITRERVRQLELRSLKRLRCSNLRSYLA